MDPRICEEPMGFDAYREAREAFEDLEQRLYGVRQE